jgi:Tol biopolymer transport system component
VDVNDDVVTKLTDVLQGGDLAPAWAPDGSQIAFSSASGIYVVNADGSGLTQLIPDAGWRPAWSPDAALILFERMIDEILEIFPMNADGSGVTRLTNHPGSDRYPCWLSPAMTGKSGGCSDSCSRKRPGFGWFL